MRTNEIIKEIERLPVSERIYVIEKAIHSIRMQGNAKTLKNAANALYSDYKNDIELTAFTNLDFVEVYETK
jgi:hypothetical protein